jgi:hypothetical protein
MNRLLHSLLVFGFLGAVAAAAGAEPAPASPDSTLQIPGGAEGAVFRDMTVEGEDRIQIEFDRPALELGLDPREAPGLDWDDEHAILERSAPDLMAMFLHESAFGKSPFTGCPWLSAQTTGPVARFHPQVKGVERWTLTVANSRGETMAVFQGKGNVPDEITWDGRNLEGRPVPPDLTYSYVFEAYDKAGNKRNFVGDGFQLRPYRMQGEGESGESVMSFSASALQGGSSPEKPSLILIETATWLNQEGALENPLRIEATARSYELAQALAERVAGELRPLLLGNPDRAQVLATVEADAPDQGRVTVTATR